MGFMEQVAAKLATKYGTVTKGKHEGCQIALGNPPEKKVEVANSFEQIIFVEGTEEKGRYNIMADLAGFAILSYDEKKFHVLLMFSNEETCEFDLDIRQEEGFLKSLIMGVILKQKTISSASGTEKLELQYRGVKVFLHNTCLRFLPKDLQFFQEHLEQKGILDDLTKDLFEICLRNAPVVEE